MMKRNGMIGRVMLLAGMTAATWGVGAPLASAQQYGYLQAGSPQVVRVGDRYQQGYYRSDDDRYRRDDRYRDGYRQYNYGQYQGYQPGYGSYRGYRDSRDERYYRDDYYRRSNGKSAAIIGGTAAAGAALGAMAGGGKGAAIGAITGGVAGLIYDRATRNKNSGYGWR